MQDSAWLLRVQEVQAFRNVECHSKLLLCGQLYLRLFLMQEREQASTGAKLCYDKYVSLIYTSAHEHDQIGVPYFQKRDNLSFKLFNRVIAVLIWVKFQFLDCNIHFFISSLKDFS